MEEYRLTESGGLREREVEGGEKKRGMRENGAMEGWGERETRLFSQPGQCSRLLAVAVELMSRFSWLITTSNGTRTWVEPRGLKDSPGTGSEGYRADQALGVNKVTGV